MTVSEAHILLLKFSSFLNKAVLVNNAMPDQALRTFNFESNQL